MLKINGNNQQQATSNQQPATSNKELVFMKVLTIFIILILAFDGHSQNNLSLDSAIIIGLENNFQIRISKEQYNIAELNNHWGTVGRFPSINLGLSSVNRYDNTPVFDTSAFEYDRGDQYTNSLTPYVNLQWLLFDGLSVNMNKQKLDMLERYSLGYSTIVVENTIQSIILGYYLVLLEEERLKVLESVKALSGDRYNYEMLRKDLGSSVTFDVLQAKNSYLSDSTNYLLQQLRVKNAFLRLNLLLGEPPAVKFTLIDSFKVELQNYAVDDLMNKMLANNRTLINQYVNQEILKKDVSIAKSDMLPTLSMNAGADYTQGWYDWEKHERNTYLFDYYANFTLSFNLFNGGNTRRAIESAKISEKIGEIEIVQAKQTLENLLVNQFDLYGIRKQLLEVAEVNLESAELNMQIATEKYRNGTINSFNFRDVQLIFLNASSNKLNAVYDLIDSQVELLRLTGGIISER
ncbi:MAG: TolC family protein [Bacteroidetes bacterium]|nr:TolC family protein [Bacteroidota bacterium]